MDDYLIMIKQTLRAHRKSYREWEKWWEAEIADRIKTGRRTPHEDD